ncbi:hypothetical protein A483_HHAL012264, partial [Halyomorpha halys]
MRLQDPWQ